MEFRFTYAENRTFTRGIIIRLSEHCLMLGRNQNPCIKGRGSHLLYGYETWAIYRRQINSSSNAACDPSAELNGWIKSPMLNS